MRSDFNRSMKSVDDYFWWRTETAKDIVRLAKKFSALKGKRALDIGCGDGALSYLLKSEGANIDALECDPLRIKRAQKLVRGLKIKEGYNESLPYDDNSFDIIFSYDVMEHVTDYHKSLREIKRCLKKDGLFVIEMTPYYSLITGHHLFRYYPFPFQFVPKWLVKKIMKTKRLSKIQNLETDFQTFLNLNKITVAKLKSELQRDSLRPIKEEYIFKTPKREIDISWIKHIWIFREIIPMSYRAIIRKVDNHD